MNGNMPQPIHLADIETTPVVETDEETRTRLLPPYHLILENDDYHSFEFVVMVLCKVFGWAAEKSFQYAMHAHTKGEAVVWTGSKEVAELKLEQMLTFHENRDDGRKFGPLSCRIEPAA